MTNLQALFRIDPTEGFIEYVKTVKPYHTKILDVLVEYVYNERVDTLVTEHLAWTYEFRRPDTETVYTCGYGYRWDASGGTTPETIAVFNIISATTNTYSANANSFLIEFTPQTQYTIAVTDKKSNELAFVSRHALNSVNPTLKRFTIAGDVSTEDYFAFDNHIYVSDNTVSVVNTRYTVVSAVYASGSTVITVEEPISLIATATGYVNIALPYDEIPYWPSGTTVLVTSAGEVPAPLEVDATYHFVPSNRVGFFALADRRYPQHLNQFIDLTTLGSGLVEIERTEPFVPGDAIVVYNAAGGYNNGNYLIADIAKEGDDFRVRVLQRVSKNTPIGMTYDGAMSLDIRSYDFPSYCPAVKSSDIHAQTFIHENFKLSFEISFNEQINTTIPINSVSHHTFPYAQYSVPTTSGNMLFGYDMTLFDVGSFDS